MDRNEYMKQLAYLLQDVPEQEKEEAMQYYEDYFDEAGNDQEQEVIRKLGTPEKVAAVIKAGITGNFGEAGEYTERGYEDERFREDKKVPDVFAGCVKWEGDRQESSGDTERTSDKSGKERKKVKLTKDKIKKEKYENRGTYEEQQTYERRKTRDSFQNEKWDEKDIRGRQERQGIGKKILLIILAVFFLIPIGLPILATLAGILFSVIAVVFALIVSGIVLMAVLAVTGIVFIGVGIGEAFLSIPLGLLCGGIGCLLIAFCIFLAWVCIWAIVRVAPWMIRKMVDLCSIPFHRRGYRR